MSDATNPDITRYLDVVGFKPDDLISVNWKRPSGGLGFRIIKVSAAHDVINARRAVDCWIGANPMRRPKDPGSRGTADDVTGVRALWADLDVGPGKLASYAACREVIAEVSELIGAQPVVIVASGHGLQPRWRFTSWTTGDTESWTEIVERFGQLVQLVAKRHGGHVDNVYDLARILRAPGTTNLKVDGKPVPVRVKFAEEPESIPTVAHLLDVLDEYVPVAPPAPAIATEPEPDPVEVSPERGNRYVKSVLASMRDELADIADWPVGRTDSRGRGWEKIQADAAYRLAELAKAEWNQLSLERAKELFADMAPTDDGWTMRDVVKKWNSQVGRAEPAPPPATVTDPLAPGYGASMEHRGDASPHAEAPDVWSGAGGDDRSAAEGGVDSVGQADLGSTDVVEDAPEGGAVDGAAGSGSRDSAESPLTWRKYQWSDRGNADRISAMFGDELRYSPVLDKWLRYSNGAWRESKTGGEKAAVEMIERLPALEAGFYDDEDVVVGRGKVRNERAEFKTWVKEQNAAAKCAAAAKMIKYIGELDAAPEQFDAEPMLLNTVNGVIDLANGELLAHDPSLMFRRQLQVPYDAEAKAPMWETFLEAAFPSIDMRDYLQRIIGYSITGMTTEQVLFFHVGLPQTGKSLFYEVLMTLMGELGKAIPPTMLLTRRNEEHPAELMKMEGGRLLALDETPEGARMNEALAKRLSGDSLITARGMGENWRDFKIIGKVHLMTNHDPHISDDAAVHRRLHYIPWVHPVPPERRVLGLKDMIISQELSGILAWAVRGTQRWVQDGLSRPMEAEVARSGYIANEDEFGQFMDEELIIGAEGSFAPTIDIRQRHAEWTRARGAGDGMSVHAITKRMKARGFEQIRTDRARGFAVALKAPRWARDPLS